MSVMNRFIDHTLLKPEATPAQIEQLCREAREFQFASVCINPGYVSLAQQALNSSGVAVCTVVGFPLGATSTASKVFETEQAIRDGATEIDMVLAIGRLKAAEHAFVSHDIQQVVAVAHRAGALVKVIFENVLLSDAEKWTACQICLAAGADFVKTSTGFAGGGATLADVALMREAVGERCGVKAAGGIRSLADAQAMLNAGANRLGTSAGVALMREASGATSDPSAAAPTY
jgi:deoxyribose-phosphate aldolase